MQTVSDYRESIKESPPAHDDPSLTIASVHDPKIIKGKTSRQFVSSALILNTDTVDYKETTDQYLKNLIEKSAQESSGLVRKTRA